MNVGYYQHFPPASFGVKIESRKSDGGEVKKVVILTKDVKAGDVIYQVLTTRTSNT